MSLSGVQRVPGGVGLDSAHCYDGANTSYEQELRAGTVLGKITSSGKWTPCKLTSLTGGDSGSGTSHTATDLHVTDARHFQVGDIISVPTQNGRLTRTISAINYSTNVITVSVAITANLTTTVPNGVGIGNCIYPDPTDDAAGAGVPRAILNEFVDLIDHDDNTARDRGAAEVLVAAVVDNAMILGDIAAYRAASDPNNKTPDGYLQHIIFADRQGF